MADQVVAPAPDPNSYEALEKLAAPAPNPNAPTVAAPGQGAPATATTPDPGSYEALEKLAAPAPPDPNAPVTATARQTPIISTGFRNRLDVRHAEPETPWEGTVGPLREAIGTGTFNLSDNAEAALEALVNRAPPPQWANRFGPNAGQAPPPQLPTTSLDDAYNQRLREIQQERAQFQADYPLASKIAEGAGAVGGGTALLKGIGLAGRAAVPALRAIPGVSRLGELLTPSMEAAATGPTDVPSLIQQLKSPALKIAKGYVIPKVLKHVLPEGTAELMADWMGVKSMGEGVIEGKDVLWNYLRNLMARRAAAGLDPSSVLPPEAPPPGAPPPEAPPPAPPSPGPKGMLPPGYSW